MVTWGLLVGLVLLPVLLSVFGPLVSNSSVVQAAPETPGSKSPSASPGWLTSSRASQSKEESHHHIRGTSALSTVTTGQPTFLSGLQSIMVEDGDISDDETFVTCAHSQSFE
jgi:hypothetical protein